MGNNHIRRGKHFVIMGLISDSNSKKKRKGLKTNLKSEIKWNKSYDGKNKSKLWIIISTRLNSPIKRQTVMVGKENSTNISYLQKTNKNMLILKIQEQEKINHANTNWKKTTVIVLTSPW